MATPVVHGQDLEDEWDAEVTPGPRRSQLALIGAVVTIYLVCQVLVICAITGKSPGGYSDDLPEPTVLETMQRRCGRKNLLSEESTTVGGIPLNSSATLSRVQGLLERRLSYADLRRGVSVAYYVCGSESPPQTIMCAYDLGCYAAERNDSSKLAETKAETSFVDDSTDVRMAIAYRVLPDYVGREKVSLFYRLFVEAMKICLPLPILSTLAVFCYLPQLMNLQGKIIVCKLLSNLLTSLWPWFVYESAYELGFLLVCSCMAGITWTTILCYDLWAAVNCQLPTSASQQSGQKFFYYSLIGWGHPGLIASVVAFAHINAYHHLVDWLAYLFFLVYVFLNLLDLLFFVFTVNNLKRHNSRHLSLVKKGRQGGSAAGGFYFYFRICALMGVMSFVFENVHIIMIGFVEYLDEDEPLKALLLGCSLLDKTLTFVILVCNKRVIGFLEKKRKSNRDSDRIS